MPTICFWPCKLSHFSADIFHVSTPDCLGLQTQPKSLPTGWTFWVICYIETIFSYILGGERSPPPQNLMSKSDIYLVKQAERALFGEAERYRYSGRRPLCPWESQIPKVAFK